MSRWCGVVCFVLLAFAPSSSVGRPQRKRWDKPSADDVEHNDVDTAQLEEAYPDGLTRVLGDRSFPIGSGVVVTALGVDIGPEMFAVVDNDGVRPILIATYEGSSFLFYLSSGKNTETGYGQWAPFGKKAVADPEVEKLRHELSLFFKLRGDTEDIDAWIESTKGDRETLDKLLKDKFGTNLQSLNERHRQSLVHWVDHVASKLNSITKSSGGWVVPSTETGLPVRIPFEFSMRLSTRMEPVELILLEVGTDNVIGTINDWASLHGPLGLEDEGTCNAFRFTWDAEVGCVDAEREEVVVAGAMAAAWTKKAQSERGLARPPLLHTRSN